MRSVASTGALLKTSTSTVTTNSIVVKSSLWRRTRHSRGRLVRVFFSVTTAVSAPSRGFRLAIPRTIVPQRGGFSTFDAGRPDVQPAARSGLAWRFCACYKAPAMSSDAKIKAELDRIDRGGAPKYHQKNAEQGKLFARERVRLLLDEGSFVEDGALANATDAELPADGVITGLGKIGGRLVALMANDSTVKAGSWGRRTVEKIVRIEEQALKLRCPLVYLVDSAGARITDQLEMFPGRRGAGRIFHLQCQLSGLVPQVCLLFGPSAAGGAYIPAFCDLVVMVEKNASMYLGSPRMAEMVIGEKVSLEELGGARMHCSVSGCGDILAVDDTDAIAQARQYFSYMPQRWREEPDAIEPGKPATPLDASVIPESE